MITERQYHILEFILNSTTGAFSKEISNIVSITPRSVRNEVNEINSIFKDNPLVKSDNKTGYTILEDKIEYVRNILFEYRNSWDNESNKRNISILGKLLNSNMNKFDLAGDLYISEQTLQRSITSVQHDFLLASNCSIQYENSVYYLQGTEVSLRKLMYQIMLKHQPKESEHVVEFLELLLPEHFNNSDYDRFSGDYSMFLHKDTEMSPQTQLILQSVLYITWIRDYLNYELESKDICNPSFNSLEADISLKLQDHCAFLTNSSNLLAQFISTFNIFDKDVDEFTQVIISEFADDVLSKYNFDIKSSESLYQTLLRHCEFMIRRLEEHYEIENPLRLHIKNTYALSYEISMLLVPILYKYKMEYLTQDELSYIALYIEHFIQHFNQKIKVILKDHSQKVVTQSTIKWLDYNYHDHLEIIDNTHSFELLLQNHDIGLIISFDESVAHPHIPTYRIYHTPTNRDIEHLNALIYQIKIRKRFQTVIENCFDDYVIRVFDSDKTFECIIQELSELMNQVGWIDDYMKYTKFVLERELIYPTPLGNGIMLPHPIFCFANKTCVAVGVLKKPIIINNESIYLILLLGTEEHENVNMAILFTLIDQLVSDQRLIDKLTDLHTPYEFLSILHSL